MTVVHNAKHFFNQGITSVPSTSLINAIDEIDPREWKGFYEDFSQVPTLLLATTSDDQVAILKSGAWRPVFAAEDDIEYTRTAQADAGGTLTSTCEAAADDSGFLQMDGGNYVMQANQPCVFECRLGITIGAASQTWFLGMGLTAGTIDQFITAAGAGFTGTDGFFFFGHDTTGTTSRAATYIGSTEALAGTSTVATGTFYTFTMVFDGTTLRFYQDGVSMGSTTEMPTGVLAPVFGQEFGATGTNVLELDYMLFYQKTGRAGVQY